MNEVMVEAKIKQLQSHPNNNAPRAHLPIYIRDNAVPTTTFHFILRRG